MLTQFDLRGSMHKISNSFNEIGRIRNNSEQIQSSKKVLPKLLSGSQDHSPTYYTDNYSVQKSTSETYESIIALYKKKSKKLRPRSSKLSRIAVVESEYPSQEKTAYL